LMERETPSPGTDCPFPPGKITLTRSAGPAPDVVAHRSLFLLRTGTLTMRRHMPVMLAALAFSCPALAQGLAGMTREVRPPQLVPASSTVQPPSGAKPATRAPTPPAAPAAEPPKPPAPPQADQLATFDPRTVDVRWEDNRWALVSGDVVLKDFGRSEADARAGARLVRELGLTQVARIGSP